MAERMSATLYGKIVVIKRNGVDGAMFPLTASSCLFGRWNECDIRIQLPNVANEHCKIDVNQNGEVLLTDLSECSPTSINSQPVVGGPARLHHKDVFTIADRSFRFEFPPGSIHRTSPVKVSPKKTSIQSSPSKSTSAKTPSRILSPLVKPPRSATKSPRKTSVSPKKTPLKSVQPLPMSSHTDSNVNSPKSTKEALLATIENVESGRTSNILTPKQKYKIHKNLKVLTPEKISGMSPLQKAGREASVQLDNLVKQSPKKKLSSPVRISQNGTSMIESPRKVSALHVSNKESTLLQKITTTPLTENGIPNSKKTPLGSPRLPSKTPLKTGITELRNQSETLQEVDDETSTPKSMRKLSSSRHKSEKGIKRHSDMSTHAIPSKKSRVSFGPQLSPEQFDKHLPTLTPIKKGKLPRRSLIDQPSASPQPVLKKRHSVAVARYSSIHGDESRAKSPGHKSQKTMLVNSPLTSVSGDIQVDSPRSRNRTADSQATSKTPSKSPGRKPKNSTPAVSPARSPEPTTKKSPGRKPKNSTPAVSPARSPEPTTKKSPGRKPKNSTPAVSPARSPEPTPKKSPGRKPKNSTPAVSPARSPEPTTKKSPGRKPKNSTPAVSPARSPEPTTKKSPGRKPKNSTSAVSPARSPEPTTKKSPGRKPKNSTPAVSPARSPEPTTKKSPGRKPKNSTPAVSPARSPEPTTKKSPGRKPKKSSPSRSPEPTTKKSPGRKPKNSTPAKSPKAITPSKSSDIASEEKNLDESGNIEKSNSFNTHKHSKVVVSKATPKTPKGRRSVGTGKPVSNKRKSAPFESTTVEHLTKKSRRSMPALQKQIKKSSRRASITPIPSAGITKAKSGISTTPKNILFPKGKSPGVPTDFLSPPDDIKNAVAVRAILGREATPKLTPAMKKRATMTPKISSTIKKSSRSASSKTKTPRQSKPSWSQIVRQGIAKKGPIKTKITMLPKASKKGKKSKNSPKFMAVPKTPRTKAAVREIQTTGHVDSPATLVIRKKTTKTPKPPPKKGKKLTSTEIVDETDGNASFSGLSELMKTPAAMSDDQLLYDDIPHSPQGPGEMLLSPVVPASSSRRKSNKVELMLTGTKRLFKNSKVKSMAVSPSHDVMNRLFNSPKSRNAKSCRVTLESGVMMNMFTTKSKTVACRPSLEPGVLSKMFATKSVIPPSSPDSEALQSLFISPSPAQKRKSIAKDSLHAKKAKPTTPGSSKRELKSTTPVSSNRELKPTTPGSSNKESKSTTPGSSNKESKSTTPGSSNKESKSATPGSSKRKSKTTSPGSSKRKSKTTSPGSSKRKSKSPKQRHSPTKLIVKLSPSPSKLYRAAYDIPVDSPVKTLTYEEPKENIYSPNIAFEEQPQQTRRSKEPPRKPSTYTPTRGRPRKNIATNTLTSPVQPPIQPDEQTNKELNCGKRTASPLVSSPPKRGRRGRAASVKTAEDQQEISVPEVSATRKRGRRGNKTSPAVSPVKEVRVRKVAKIDLIDEKTVSQEMSPANMPRGSEGKTKTDSSNETVSPKTTVVPTKRRGRVAKITVTEDTVPPLATSPALRRGRKAKATRSIEQNNIVSPPTKRRRRPAKNTGMDESEETSVVNIEKRSVKSQSHLGRGEPTPDDIHPSPIRRGGRRKKDLVVTEKPATPKPRGRPKKGANAIVEDTVVNIIAEKSSVKSRSRLGRGEASEPSQNEEALVAQNETHQSPIRRGGRRKKDIVVTEKPATPKPRGRPKKGADAVVEDTEVNITTEKSSVKSRSRLGRGEASDPSPNEEALVAQNETHPSPIRRGGRRKKDLVVTEKPATPKPRGRPKKGDHAIVEDTVSPVKRRGRRGQIAEPVAPIGPSVEPVIKKSEARGRKRKEELSTVIPTPKKSRSNSTTVSPEVKRITRARKK